MDEKDVENTSQSQYSDDEVDGTSPAVIAQVSELLNYVYGKTSVPGQIDRVSTIMRAYEGREAVLLELLETKALIKANREKENAGNLPSFLRNSANAQKNLEQEIMAGGDMPAVTPMAMQNQPAINDDISSMSGVSTPAPPGQQAVLKPIAVSETKIHTFFQLYPCSQLVFLCCSLHRKPPSQFDQPSMSTQVWIRTRIEP
jgi:hypothetical protein